VDKMTWSQTFHKKDQKSAIDSIYFLFDPPSASFLEHKETFTDVINHFTPKDVNVDHVDGISFIVNHAYIRYEVTMTCDNDVPSDSQAILVTITASTFTATVLERLIRYQWTPIIQYI